MRRIGKKWLYYGGTLLLVISWYALTGVESCHMGYNPLVRRSFTSLDTILIVFVILACFALCFWYRRSD